MYLQFAGKPLMAERQMPHAVQLQPPQYLHELTALAMWDQICQNQLCQPGRLRHRMRSIL